MTATAGHRTILVPLDGSSFAEQALALALPLARATGRGVRLVHIQALELWPDEMKHPETISSMRRMLHAEGESYLRGVQHRFQAPDLEVDIAVLKGEGLPIGQVLNTHVLEHPVDLIIMATHGRGGVRRAWLGSVADHVIRHLLVPVIVVRPGMVTVPSGNRILLPLDGSPQAEGVLEEACTLAAVNQQEILLLRVITPVMQSFTSLETPYVAFDAELTAVARSAAEEYLDEVEERIRAWGVGCSGMTVLASSPAECIIDIARPGHFAMIAMATHGRGGLRRLVLGSVADKVVRGADIPVLVIRPPATASPDAPRPPHVKLAGPRSCSL